MMPPALAVLTLLAAAEPSRVLDEEGRVSPPARATMERTLEELGHTFQVEGAAALGVAGRSASDCASAAVRLGLPARSGRWFVVAWSSEAQTGQVCAGPQLRELPADYRQSLASSMSTHASRLPSIPDYPVIATLQEIEERMKSPPTLRSFLPRRIFPATPYDRPLSWLGLAVALGGPFAIAWGLRSALRALTSSRWPTVPGIIVSARKVDFVGWQSQRDVLRVPNVAATVAYQYDAEGRSRTGNRIQVVDIWTTSDRRPNEILKRYPVGKNVTVYHHPRDPDFAVLEPGYTPWVLLRIAAGLFMIGFGVIWYFIWRP